MNFRALDTPVPLPSEACADETRDRGGAPRAHWGNILESLSALGPAALEDRATKIARILRDDGAIHALGADPVSPGVNGSLDAVPFVIESEEWRSIEAGLVERAELLNLVLRDLYGARELLRRRVVPPELLFTHPGFLRACQDIRLPGEHDLLVLATDIARGLDGRFYALGDGTRSPAGAGYALENRLAISRVFPSLFRESHVHRLAIFFRTLRATLNRLAMPPEGDPRVVVLTPGSFNESYFEHTYLANYLGYSLVQGTDLVCQNDRLWVKSVGGLERVDAVVRRVDDLFCDPVELYGDSRIGVPGLVEVARSGNIVLANPLGAGVLENPALMKYSDAIGRHFLGREPRLPAAPTWWCGDPDDYDYVTHHLDQLVIRSNFEGPVARTLLPGRLSETERKALRARIAARPNRFSAQSPMRASEAPVLAGGELRPRPVSLRCFCVAEPGSYLVMPGALGIVSPPAAVVQDVRPTSSITKDTWVLASEPGHPAPAPPSAKARAIGPSGRLPPPSRVVENLFWMGRYAERAEYAIRLLRTIFLQTNPEMSTRANSPPRAILLRALTQITYTFPGFLGPEGESLIANPEPELLSVILDVERPGSVRANLSRMFGAALDVQEELSADIRRVLSDIRDKAGGLPAALGGDLSSAPEEALDPLVTYLIALAGLSNESMMHGLGWRFTHIGRRLERALLTGALLESALGRESNRNDEADVLAALLSSVENLVDYRRVYRSQPEIIDALPLLMMNRTNPRSLLFQLLRLETHLSTLPFEEPAMPNDPRLSPTERLILEARTVIELADPERLLAPDPATGERPHLKAVLARTAALLSEIADVVAERFFDHTAGPWPLLAAQRNREL